MVRIGFRDFRIWNSAKFIVFGKLIFGDNSEITAESVIVFYKEIIFGENCLISWDNLIMDTDLHRIKD